MIDYTKNFDSNIDTVDYEEVEEVNEVEETSYDTKTSTEGRISGAKKVYLRQHPSKDSEGIKILDEGTKVIVADVEINDDGEAWYSVTIENGNSGYVIGDFVNLLD